MPILELKKERIPFRESQAGGNFELEPIDHHHAKVSSAVVVVVDVTYEGM